MAGRNVVRRSRAGAISRLHDLVVNREFACRRPPVTDRSNAASRDHGSRRRLAVGCWSATTGSGSERLPGQSANRSGDMTPGPIAANDASEPASITSTTAPPVLPRKSMALGRKSIPAKWAHDGGAVRRGAVCLMHGAGDVTGQAAAGEVAGRARLGLRPAGRTSPLSAPAERMLSASAWSAAMSRVCGGSALAPIPLSSASTS